MKNSFSLIELLFVIAVLGILVSVALPKFSSTLSQTNKIQAKNDIVLIRNALNNYKNKHLLLGTSTTLDSLDTDQNKLFSKILSTPISNKIWKKINNTQYLLSIDNQTTINFFYSPELLTFDCDFSNIICQELSQ